MIQKERIECVECGIIFWLYEDDDQEVCDPCVESQARQERFERYSALELLDEFYQEEEQYEPR